MRTILEVTIWDERSNAAGSFTVGKNESTPDVAAASKRLGEALKQYGYQPTRTEAPLAAMHAERAAEIERGPAEKPEEAPPPQLADFREGIPSLPDRSGAEKPDE